jgi:hypothetical protein
MGSWIHGTRSAGATTQGELHVTWIDEREAQEPEKIRAALADYARRRETPQLSRVAQYDGGDERFGLWLALVDARIVRRVGIGLFDLADWNMRDAYESGSSPRDAAQEALESDDLYASFVGGAE